MNKQPINTLSKQNKFIFIHIPKTAGESIRKALSTNSKLIKINSNSSLVSNSNFITSYDSTKNVIVRAIEHPEKTGKKIFYKVANWLNPTRNQWLYLHKHSTAREIKSILSEEEWNNCFTFAFVRNPYDRVVSFYHHLRKPLYISKKTLGRQYPKFLNTGLLEPKEACQAAMKYEFNEWIVKVYEHEEYNHYGWLDSQLRWLTDERGELIVDFVGKYEELEDSWQTICNSLNIIVDLPKLNSSSRVSYRSYYSASSRRIIEAKFERDLLLYQYDF